MLTGMANRGHMKTTLDIHDELLCRARRHALDTGSTLRAVVEDGLWQVLDRANPIREHVLPDLRVGGPGRPRAQPPG